MQQQSDKALVENGLDGDRTAHKQLMSRLLRVVRAEARATLRRAGQPGHRAQLDDFVQESLCRLFRDDARSLRGWNPSLGLQLESFVRLIVRRSLRDQLARKCGVNPVEPEWFEHVGEDRLGAAAETRNELDLVLAALDLSGRDRELFERLVLEGQSTAEVAAALQMTGDAVKKWRSRLYGRAREIRDRLRREPGPQRRSQ